MVCGKCGNKVDEGLNFCPYCGNTIKKKDLITDNKETEVANEVEILDSNDTAQLVEKDENLTNEQPATIDYKVELINNNEDLTNSPTIGEDSNTNVTVNLMETNNQSDVQVQNTNSQSEALPITFGIIGLLFCILPLSIVAVVTGFKYKKKNNKGSVGLVLGIIGLVIQSLIIFCLALILALSFKVGGSSGNSSGNKINDYYEDGSTSNYQVVGNNKFGYLTISKDWSIYSYSNGDTSLQYSYKDSSSILTIFAIQNPDYSLQDYVTSIKERLQGYGATDISNEIVTVGKYTAIKQQTYLSSLSSYMTTWCFQDENGALHYISVNAPSSDDFQDIVSTFSLSN